MEYKSFREMCLFMRIVLRCCWNLVKVKSPTRWSFSRMKKIRFSIFCDIFSFLILIPYISRICHVAMRVEMERSGGKTTLGNESRKWLVHYNLVKQRAETSFWTGFWLFWKILILKKVGNENWSSVGWKLVVVLCSNQRVMVTMCSTCCISTQVCLILTTFFVSSFFEN